MSAALTDGMKGLTLKLEPKVDHPYASRDRYDPFVLVPNGNAGSAHKQIATPRGRRSYRPKAEEDALAEYDQERSRNKSQAPKELQRKEEGEEKKVPTTRHSSDCTLRDGRGMLTISKEVRTYGIVACQGAGAYVTDCGNDIPDNCIGP